MGGLQGGGSQGGGACKRKQASNDECWWSGLVDGVKGALALFTEKEGPECGLGRRKEEE